MSALIVFLVIVLVVLVVVGIVVTRSKTAGRMTKYGRIIRKPFGDGFEMIPEHVYHLPDSPKLRLNQFIYTDPGDPWRNESWCTQSPVDDRTAPGKWDSPRKLRTAMLVDAGIYPEVCLLETNMEPDHTFGVVGPLVCVLSDGSQYVAVNPQKARRGGKIMEAMRQRHGSFDAKPIATDGTNMVITEYGSDKIGLLLTNSACIHGVTPDGEIRLALVRGELLVASGIANLPTLNSPFVWVPLAEFMLLSMDDHSQAVIGRAIVAGYLAKPADEIVEPVLKKLPAFVAEQCK